MSHPLSRRPSSVLAVGLAVGGLVLLAACADQPAPLAPRLRAPEAQPLLVSQPGPFTAVSAGLYHSCGVRSDGAAECWGLNDDGQAPPMKTAAVGTFVVVSGGYPHTCGLRSDGVAECWGYDGFGAAPATRSATTGSFVGLSAGAHHNCALRTDGVVECWGWDGNGQAPATRTAAAGSFVAVSGGFAHSCALRNDGIVECWGLNDNGQAPASVQAATGQFVEVGTGTYHDCALRTDGVIECWGKNDYGQAPATKSAAVGSFVAVSVGGAFTCALRSDGVVECWGVNFDGQAPATKSAAQGRFVAVEAGFTHTCALRDDSVVECWGYNFSGQAPATRGVVPPPIHVLPAATFNAPASAVVGQSIQLSLSNAHVPGYPQATSFTYAFDCGSGYDAASPNAGATCTATAAGTLMVRGKVIDQDGDFAEYSATANVTAIAQAITFTTLPPTPALVRGSYAVSATGGGSGNPVIFASLTPATCGVSGSTVSLNAVGTCTIAANQAGNAAYSAAPQVTQSFAVVYGFAGFSQPVDNLPTVNTANSGQAIPLKWRAVDATGAPVTNLTTVRVTVTSLPCSIGSTPDQLEEYATGASGLQNLGNGYYQFNWKTPKTYAKSCKTMHLDLGDGLAHDAVFNFTK